MAARGVRNSNNPSGLSSVWGYAVPSSSGTTGKLEVTMSHIDLPNEIFCMIAQHLPNHASISALMRTDRRMYHLLREYLYEQISGNEKNDTLNWAAKHGHEKLVQEMLQRGGDIRLVTPPSVEIGRSKPELRRWIGVAIGDAAENGHASIVRILLEWQVSALNICSGYDDRPLRKAATNGHPETVKILLEHSANIPPDAINDLACGPPSSINFSRILNEALRQGQEETVNVLLTDTRVILNNQSLTAAAVSGNEKLVDLCLREAPPWPPNSGYESPLGAAARRGHEAAFRMILNSDGIDPNMRDDSLRTPLAVAADYGQKKILQILLETPGVELDPEDKTGATPLQHAASRGNTELVEKLLATGAVDVNSTAAYNFTPLYSAANAGHHKIVSMLIAAGANPEHRNADGRTPLSSAASSGAADVVKVLLATGRVNPSSRDRYKRTPLIEAAMSGRFLGRPDDFVRNQAYEKEAEKIIIPLLGGENIETPIVKDQPPGKDGTQNTSTRQALSVMKQLLAIEEVDPNAQDSSGRTALSHAAEMHEVNAVRVLLEDKRVNVNLADKDGWTPMTWITKKVKSCPWNYDWGAYHGI